MRLERRSTENEPGPYGAIHVIEFVVVGEYRAAGKVAEYMDDNVHAWFEGSRGDRFAWGRDWDDSDHEPDAQGNEVGETTFYLEAEHGSVAEGVKLVKQLYREAKQAARVAKAKQATASFLAGEHDPETLHRAGQFGQLARRNGTARAPAQCAKLMGLLRQTRCIANNLPALPILTAWMEAFDKEHHAITDRAVREAGIL
jgi:hypothetical protein